MAMNGDILGDAILAAVDAAVAANAEVGSSQRQAIFRGIGNAIVQHIQGNAQVTTTVAVASVGGVTPGGGTSGPGTGTGTGSIA